jgi:hypothetical protein
VGRDRYHLTVAHGQLLPHQPAQGALGGPGGAHGPRLGEHPLHAQPLPQETGPPTVTPKRFSDVLADLILEPIFGVQFRGTATFDPYESRVTSATTDFVYEAARWRAAFGTRHGENGKLFFLQSALEAKLGARWTVRASSDYDVDTGTVIENRLEIDFREQCWGITASFIDRTDEDEFRITVNLLELGQYGFGRAFAGQQ